MRKNPNTHVVEPTTKMLLKAKLTANKLAMTHADLRHPYLHSVHTVLAGERCGWVCSQVVVAVAAAVRLCAIAQVWSHSH